MAGKGHEIFFSVLSVDRLSSPPSPSPPPLPLPSSICKTFFLRHYSSFFTLSSSPKWGGFPAVVKSNGAIDLLLFFFIHFLSFSYPFSSFDLAESSVKDPAAPESRQDRVRTMCGIIASILADPEGNCGPELYEGLNVLQHRGQVRSPPFTSSSSYVLAPHLPSSLFNVRIQEDFVCHCNTHVFFNNETETSYDICTTLRRESWWNPPAFWGGFGCSFDEKGRSLGG